MVRARGGTLKRARDGSGARIGDWRRAAIGQASAPRPRQRAVDEQATCLRGGAPSAV
jgi:hypothetical protein